MAALLVALGAVTVAHGQGAPARLVTGSTFDASHGLYNEGFVNRFRLSRSGHTVLFATGDGINRQVPPGKYRLSTSVRPCSGNCGHLDPPQNRCARGVRLRAGAVLKAHVRRSLRGCFIALSSDLHPIQKRAALAAARRFFGRWSAGCHRRAFLWRCVAKRVGGSCRVRLRVIGIPSRAKVHIGRLRC
jgi:hypothetical protein